MLKQDSLLWKAALHHEQLMATISFEPNDNLDWKDCVATTQNKDETQSERRSGHQEYTIPSRQWQNVDGVGFLTTITANEEAEALIEWFDHRVGVRSADQATKKHLGPPRAKRRIGYCLVFVSLCFFLQYRSPWKRGTSINS